MVKVDFSVLKGKTFAKVDVEDDTIIFHCVDGCVFEMYHRQDCCEDVVIEDICGEVEALLHTPILKAEESIKVADSEDGHTRNRWTFYKLATIKGHVDIRWWGSSNGYYSEEVSLVQISADVEEKEVKET